MSSGKKTRREIDMINGPLLSGVIRYTIPVILTGVLYVTYSISWTVTLIAEYTMFWIIYRRLGCLGKTLQRRR